jgi:hypothetical protein
MRENSGVRAGILGLIPAQVKLTKVKSNQELVRISVPRNYQAASYASFGTAEHGKHSKTHDLVRCYSLVHFLFEDILPTPPSEYVESEPGETT